MYPVEVDDQPEVKREPLRPLLIPAALGLLAGAVLATWLGAAAVQGAWLWLAALAVVAASAVWCGVRAAGLPVASLFVVAGALWVGSRLVPEPDLPRLVDQSGTLTRVYPRSFQQSAVLRLDQSMAGFDQVFVRLPRAPVVWPGDRVRLVGLWQEEMWGEEVVRTVHASAVEVLARREASWRGRAFQAVERLEERGLAEALLLGSGRPPVRKVFRQAGLLHVLAVSGLHLALAMMGFAWVLQLASVPWWTRQWLLIACATGYLFLTGAAVPTQRALIMVWAWQAAALSGRRVHRLAPLALAAIALVVVHPRSLAAPGFQLTLAAVAGMCTVGRQLLLLRQRWLPCRPWPLDRPTWRAWLWLCRSVMDGLVMGLCACLAIVPIIAWHFNEVQPYSAVASVLAAPFVTASLLLGLLYLVLAAVFPSGPWIGLQVLLDHCLGGLTDMATWVAAWPGSHLHVVAPPAWVVLAWPGLFVGGGTWPWWLGRALLLATLVSGWCFSS